MELEDEDDEETKAAKAKAAQLNKPKEYDGIKINENAEVDKITINKYKQFQGAAGDEKMPDVGGALNDELDELD